MTTYSLCIAITTALEKGAEVVDALIAAAEYRRNVVSSMHLFHCFEI